MNYLITFAYWELANLTQKSWLSVFLAITTLLKATEIYSLLVLSNADKVAVELLTECGFKFFY